MEENKNVGLTAGTLKIIALITMAIDHLTYVFVPMESHPQWYMDGRIIGRLSFPIFCFLLVEGYYHTHDLKKYLKRLFLFALISEIPFDLAFKGKLVYLGHQNVMFTLFTGLLFIWLLDFYCKIENMTIQMFCKAGTSLVILLAAYFFRMDYSYYGILLIVLFYKFHEYRTAVVVSNVFFNLVMAVTNVIQAFGALSSILLLLYNGQKGKSSKYFFYIFYPGHLLVIYVIKMILG